MAKCVQSTNTDVIEMHDRLLRQKHRMHLQTLHTASITNRPDCFFVRLSVFFTACDLQTMYQQC